MEASQRSKKQIQTANAVQKTRATEASAGTCSHLSTVALDWSVSATPIVQVRLIRDASAPKRKITCAREVVAVCKDMRKLDREHFRAIYLDSRNGLLGMETIAIGSLNASLVHPREVFKAAILLNAAALVVVHNHPSGATEMSEEDMTITNNLIKAGELLGIEVLDHVVIGDGHYSLAEQKAQATKSDK